MRPAVLFVVVTVGAFAACDPSGVPQAARGQLAPIDDPAHWDGQIDTTKTWTPMLGDVDWLIPSERLPDETPTWASNNNVGIHISTERTYVAWRTGPTHWASPEVLLYVISKAHGSDAWEHERTVELGSDCREPVLYERDGTIFFVFFEAGDSLFEFHPRRLWRTERRGLGDWTDLEEWGTPGEVAWDIKEREGRLLMTHYGGERAIGVGEASIEIRLSSSEDGLSWAPISGDGVVYRGGASEAAFELDATGDLWAVLRNEDGDETGFGSLVCRAPASDIAAWECPDVADPERYDSPRMFRHGDDVYLLARRDIGGPFDQQREDLSDEDKKQAYATAYWNRPKRTALYRIDKEAHQVVHVFDLPSAGDTAFPVVRRLGPHRFLIANYTSPPDDGERTWIEGQGALDGTQIYLAELWFEAE